MTIGQLFTKVDDLKPFKTTWRVRVKVLHSWRQFVGQPGETMEYVFADEHGGKIHAAVKKKDIARISKDLRVGEWKVLDNLQVAPASGQYRPTSNRWKMTTTLNTVVSSCSVKSDSQFLSLVPIHTINEGVMNHCFLIDVMGQVLNVQDIKNVPVGGKEKRKLEFVLRDIDDERINGCLWESYADLLYDACKKSNGETLICLIRFAKIGFYQGVLQITNGYDASKLIINPKCPEAELFRQRLPSDGLAVVIREEDAVQVQHEKREKDEEWLKMDLTSVDQIKTATEIEKYRIRGKVAAIDTDWGWYYFGCTKCQHRVTKNLKKEGSNRPRPKVPIWYCEICKSDVTSVSGKFKLHLIIEDDSGVTKIMLLDTLAQGVVNKSAAALLNGSTDEIQDPELLPDSIKKLVGSTFDLLIGVEKEHIHYGSDTYKVHKVKKGATTVHADSSNDVITADDDLSQIQSDHEPGSVVKSNGSTPSPKRNIEEISGIPELSSTSKKHCPKIISLEEENEEKDETKKSE